MVFIKTKLFKQNIFFLFVCLNFNFNFVLFVFIVKFVDLGKKKYFKTYLTF